MKIHISSYVVYFLQITLNVVLLFKLIYFYENDVEKYSTIIILVYIINILANREVTFYKRTCQLEI